MMMRTHVLLALSAGLALLPSVTHRISFLPVIVLATLLPDIDCTRSYLGKYWFFRPLQWCTRHRGLFHSLTFCLGATLILALFIPVFALPFFLGYLLHLFADSVTVEGVYFWWPKGGEVRGVLRTGGSIEQGIFYVLCGVCVLLTINLIV